jgi:hypothetical protein
MIALPPADEGPPDTGTGASGGGHPEYTAKLLKAGFGFIEFGG